MGEQGTSPGSRKRLCQDEGRRFCEPSEEAAVMSRSADHDPGMDRRVHKGRLLSWEKMLGLHRNAGTRKSWVSTNLRQFPNYA